MGRANEVTQAEHAIAHCRRLIERAEAEIERRPAFNYYAEQARLRLATYRQLLAEHQDNLRRLRGDAGARPGPPRLAPPDVLLPRG